MSDLEYLSCSDVADHLASTTTSIIDVRGVDEYSYGHLPGSVNIPSGKWDDANFVDSVVTSYADADRLVFHCMHSQKRGPTCARIFKTRMNLSESSNKPKM